MSDSFVDLGTLRSRPSSGVAWTSWGPAPFDRAARERKPVLLAIGASWCHGCAVMDATTYSVPEIVSTINERCVPVRVDADRRPDINERYNLDGWPTTAFLTPSGEVLTGSTYVVPDQMARMLEEVVDGLAARYDELMARADAARAGPSRCGAAARYEPDLAGARMAHRAHPGAARSGVRRIWRRRQVPARLAAALRAGAVRDHAGPTARGADCSTLDAMAWGGIFDEVDGGFFRYAAGRDWTRPHTEKMLEDQAAMVGLLIDGSLACDRASWRERARDVMRYVQRTLADAARGGFYASQRADEEYYAVNASIRETLDAPVVDRTLFTDVNAQAAVTWLRAGEALEDTDAGRFAVQSLERVLLATYKPGEGVAPLSRCHWRGARAAVRPGACGVGVVARARRDRRRNLPDARRRARANRAAHALGRSRRRLPRSRARRRDDIGLLRDPVKPLALNCLAAACSRGSRR